MLLWHLSISPSMQCSLFVLLNLATGPNAKEPLCDFLLIFYTQAYKVSAWVCQVSPGDLRTRLFTVNPIPWSVLHCLWFEGSLTTKTAYYFNLNQVHLRCGHTIIPSFLHNDFGHTPLHAGVSARRKQQFFSSCTCCFIHRAVFFF